MDVFLTKYGHEMRAMCFLENGRLFETTWELGQYFFCENRKKGHAIDFFLP